MKKPHFLPSIEDRQNQSKNKVTGVIFILNMTHQQGIPREQIQMLCLEGLIGKDNPVRFIEAFVEKLDLIKLGFTIQIQKSEGRPSYESKLFLKIYLYGYVNGLRSCRRLACECVRNIELHWLLHSLTPNYHSINDFRKNNSNALRNTFKLFVLFLKDADLIGGETIAIDGTKSRASNSKKNNYNAKKIERHLKYIDEKIQEYLGQLEANDKQESELDVKHIQDKINRLAESKLNYEALQKQLNESEEPQVSTTDPDARALLIHGQVVEVSYNMQAAVDAKHNLVIATQTINRNDRNALTDIALEAKRNIEAEAFTVLVDKGYHNGRQIQQVTDANITTLVANPEVVNTNKKSYSDDGVERGTTKEYMASQFTYNKESDTYTCPQGETLETKGTWHEKKDGKKVHYRFKQYRTPACKTCPVQHLCTGKADGRRELQRSEFAEAVEANNKRYAENGPLYRKRQEINEHIFGTIKRQWNYYYTNLRGLKKVNGEHSLIMLVYNIKRTINILGMGDLMEKLKNWTPNYDKIAWLRNIWTHFKPKYANLFSTQLLSA